MIEKTKAFLENLSNQKNLKIKTINVFVDTLDGYGIHLSLPSTCESCEKCVREV